MEYMDGSPARATELVDIGRDRWPYKWENIDLFRWKFLNYSPDILDSYWQQRAFATAFRSINFLIKPNFRFQRELSMTTHFTIEFIDNPDVFGSPHTIAQAYLFRPGSSMNGVIQFNDNFFFTPFGDSLPAYLVDPDHYTEGQTYPDGRLIMLGTMPLLEVAMHEIKHALGYWHDENSPESMLFPYVKPGYNPDGSINRSAFIWTDDDILRWEEGYTARRFRWLNRFRARRLRGRSVPGLPYRVVV